MPDSSLLDPNGSALSGQATLSGTNIDPAFNSITPAPQLGNSGVSGTNLGDYTFLDAYGTMPSSSDLSNPLDTASLGQASADSIGNIDASGASSGGFGNILSSLGSGLGSALSSPLGQLGTYAGLYGVLANQASSAANQNNTLAGQISAIGQPDVTAGQNLLANNQAGTLGTPYQQEVANAQQQNQNAATSQSQQVSQLLANSSSGNVQSAMASQGQQITSAQALANSQAVVSAFQNQLSDSLALTGQGGQYVQSGIMQEIQSNTQLQGQLANLMGMLANAYAKSSSGSGGSAGSGVGSAVGNGLNQLIKQLTNSNPSSSVNPNNLANYNSQDAALLSQNPDLSNPLDTSSLGAASAASIGDVNFGGVAGGGYGDLTDATSGALDVSGDALSAGQTADDIASFSSAGGQAATSGADNIAGAAGNSVANSVDTSSVSSAGSFLGAGAAGLGLYGSVTNAYNDPTATNVGNAAVSGAGAASAASSALGGGALLGAGALGALGAGVAIFGGATDAIIQGQQRGPPLTFNPEAGVTQNPDGTLPSGNSIATIGDLGIGEGNNNAQGSGQLYQVNPNGSTSANTTYNWLGQNDTTALEQDYQQYIDSGGSSAGGMFGISGAAFSQSELQALQATGQGTPAEIAQLQAQIGESGNAANPGYQGLEGLYTSTGGANEWGGESQATWTNNLIQLLGDANSNGGAGLYVGH